MGDVDNQFAVARTLQALRAEQRLLQQLLCLEVIRDQLGGAGAVRELLAEEGREPIDIDAVLARFGVDSVGERLVDLRSDIEVLESMLHQG